MIALILRVALCTLGIAFIGWWLYVTYLGLKTFFKNKESEKTDGAQA